MLRRPSPLWTASLFALLAVGSSVAGAQSLRAGAINETIRGGLTTDGWSEVSTPTTYATGALHIRIPRGGRVRQALLYSTILNFAIPGSAAPTTVPAGPAGSPREVRIGVASGEQAVRLEGMPRYSASTIMNPSGTYRLFWGTFVSDVTSALRATVGPSAAGGAVINVPIRERGDEGARYSSTEILGHSLVVEYELDYGPFRNLVVYEGAATTGFTSPALAIPGRVANFCPMMNPPANTEPFAAAISDSYDFNYTPASVATGGVCAMVTSPQMRPEEDVTVTVNGLTLTQNAGGSDDWGSVAAGTGCGVNTAGLHTFGSFGGQDVGSGFAAGSPMGLEGDQIGAGSIAPRLDDELYDFRSVVADNATTINFGILADGDQVVSVIALQTLARRQDGDADADGWADSVEGDCRVDTDRDGTPDYLDTDSDNDCLPDARETAAGRTSATIPGSPNANCPANAPVCDTTAGVCLCNASSDCPTQLPVCDPATRSCRSCAPATQATDCPSAARPVCGTQTGNMGLCVQCNSDSNCRLPTPTCNTVTWTCTGCNSNSDCRDPMRPICDSAAHVCRPCSAATERMDCTDPLFPRCAATGSSVGRCVECVSTGDCPRTRPTCGTDNACHPCSSDSDCMGSAPACATMGTRTGQCVPCTADRHCTGSAHCDTAMNVCVGCRTNADCSGSTPICDGVTHVCRACDPAGSDCSGSTPACATAGTRAGRCVECTTAMRSACVSPRGACDGDRNACVVCVMDTDCADPRPHCLRAMDPTSDDRCVECVTDPHCATRTDGRVRCIGPSNTCAECSPTDSSACSADAAGAACLTSGLCGCTSDSDCSPSRMCNPATARCEPRATPDAGPEDSGNTGFDAGMLEASPTATFLSGDGACGCRTAGAPAQGSARSAGLLASLGVALALGARRRRRG